MTVTLLFVCCTRTAVNFYSHIFHYILFYSFFNPIYCSVACVNFLINEYDDVMMMMMMMMTLNSFLDNR